MTCDDEEYAAAVIEPLQGKPVKLTVAQGSVTLMPAAAVKAEAAAAPAKAKADVPAGVCFCTCVCEHPCDVSICVWICVLTAPVKATAGV